MVISTLPGLSFAIPSIFYYGIQICGFKISIRRLGIAFSPLHAVGCPVSGLYYFLHFMVYLQKRILSSEKSLDKFFKYVTLVTDMLQGGMCEISYLIVGCVKLKNKGKNHKISTDS